MDLYRNNLINIKGIGTAKNLESISLGYNKISSIKELSSLTKLSSVHLNNNKITGVEPLSSLTNLESLGVSNNYIKDISSLRGLPKLALTYIDFSGNPLPKYVFEDKLKDESILSNLEPYIDSDIRKYFGGFRQYMSPGILSIEKSGGKYRLKVRVTTFIGPHNPPYGKGTMIITQDYTNIKVEEFKHEDVK